MARQQFCAHSLRAHSGPPFVAVRESANSLRATTSAARYWAQRGERRRAGDMLSPIYRWFSEGFDTADLLEARELLNALQ
jgi:hypothetical protein